MENRIDKQIELNAPVSRVWRALTDAQEFGAWFGINMADIFVPGQPAKGLLTYERMEHIELTLVVQKMEPERYFSFTWHPYFIDPENDDPSETPTLVEFTLEQTGSGTLLKIAESGFENIPSARRAEAFLMNSEGWSEQMTSIERYVSENP